MATSNGSAGFTAIEVLATVAILAIIVLTVVSNLPNYQRSARATAQFYSAHNYVTAMNRESILTLETRLTERMSDNRSSLLQWFTGMLIGQAALVAALVKLL